MWKYIGSGWIAGIPARDISQEEFQKMDKEERELIETCGLFELMEQKEKPKKNVRNVQESE